ncbi:MAG TPA: hypothetical protein VGL42_16580 [Opitutaceae bacterium]|jgi:hypothetical protein
MTPEPDPLDRLLDRLRDFPEPPGNLKADVRYQIARRSERPAKPGLLGGFDAVFGRPSFAIVFVAACVFLGMFLAEVRLERLNAERGTKIAQSYLRLIDPLMEAKAGKIATPQQ